MWIHYLHNHCKYEKVTRTFQVFMEGRVEKERDREGGGELSGGHVAQTNLESTM